MCGMPPIDLLDRDDSLTPSHHTTNPPNTMRKPTLQRTMERSIVNQTCKGNEKQNHSPMVDGLCRGTVSVKHQYSSSIGAIQVFRLKRPPAQRLGNVGSFIGTPLKCLPYDHSWGKSKTWSLMVLTYCSLNNQYPTWLILLFNESIRCFEVMQT